MHISMQFILVCLGLWLAAPAHAAPAAFRPLVAEGGSPSARAVYDRIMANFAAGYRALPFPAEAAAIRAAYERYDARAVFQNLETAAHLELLHLTDPARPLGREGERARAGNLVRWSLWLVSREGPDHAVNLPGPAGSPWEARKLRGWGSRDFDNGSSNFRGWHTYSEQTAAPLIGMLTTAAVLRKHFAAHPALRDARVFGDGEWKALEASGRMRIAGLDLRTLTYGGAEAFLVRYAGEMLDWWMANAMTRRGNLRYFWYTAVGDAHFGKTRRPARDWFIVHANQLMGRAAFLYAELTGLSRYRDLAFDLYGAFLTAHHPCYRWTEETTCYRYGVWGADLAPRMGGGITWALGTAFPGEVGALPERNLEEPYHMNSSHALVGLLHGRSLLNRRDFSGGAGDLEAIQRSYPLLYRAAGDGAPLQAVAGPPRVLPRFGAWWVVIPDKLVPGDKLAGEALAAFYLAEGASDETFALLTAWWDAWGRQAAAAGAYPMAGANFPKLGVFLAAEAFARAAPGPTLTAGAASRPAGAE